MKQVASNGLQVSEARFSMRQLNASRERTVRLIFSTLPQLRIQFVRQLSEDGNPVHSRQLTIIKCPLRNSQLWISCKNSTNI